MATGDKIYFVNEILDGLNKTTKIYTGSATLSSGSLQSVVTLTKGRLKRAYFQLSTTTTTAFTVLVDGATIVNASSMSSSVTGYLCRTATDISVKTSVPDSSIALDLAFESLEIKANPSGSVTLTYTLEVEE